MKKNITATAFTGINNLNVKDMSEIQTGKNFRTTQGVLTTRTGNTILNLNKTFSSPIKSIHSCGISQMTTRLLVQEGSNLWLYNADSWTNLKSDLSGNTLKSCSWSSYKYGNFLVLVNGSQSFQFDIAGATLGILDNEEVGTGHIVPNMEKVVSHHGFVFGLSPNYSPSNTLKFNSYFKETVDGEEYKYKSIDYWSPAFQIDASNKGETALDFVNFDTHLLVLTNRGAYRLEGSDENSFTPYTVGNFPVYAIDCASKVGSYVMYLGNENGRKKVYMYAGSEIQSIGEKIEEELNDRLYTKIFTHGQNGKFYVFMSNTTLGNTKVFIFDIHEKQWYIDYYDKVFISVCEHHDNFTDAGYMLVACSDNSLLKFSNVDTDNVNTNIPTEFSYLLQLGRDKSKLKSIWVTAEPELEFTLNIKAKGDENPETDTFSLTFSGEHQKAQKVKIRRCKGSNILITISSTQKIDKLVNITFVVIPKKLK